MHFINSEDTKEKNIYTIIILALRVHKGLKWIGVLYLGILSLLLFQHSKIRVFMVLFIFLEILAHENRYVRRRTTKETLVRVSCPYIFYVIRIFYRFGVRFWQHFLSSDAGEWVFFSSSQIHVWIQL